MWLSRANVKGLECNGIFRRVCRKEICSSNVLDMNEVSQLSPIFVNDWRKSSKQLALEDGCDTGVRRVSRHTRPVNVVITKCYNRDSIMSTQSHAEKFLIEL